MTQAEPLGETVLESVTDPEALVETLALLEAHTEYEKLSLTVPLALPLTLTEKERLGDVV